MYSPSMFSAAVIGVPAATLPTMGITPNPADGRGALCRAEAPAVGGIAMDEPRFSKGLEVRLDRGGGRKPYSRPDFPDGRRIAVLLRELADRLENPGLAVGRRSL